MKEKKRTKNDEGSNSIIYSIVILLGMVLIGILAFYAPMMIFAMLFLTPFAVKYDMEISKPILSIGLIMVCGVFLFFNQFSYSIYLILVVSTGLSAITSFMIWRFFRAEDFSEGLKYTLLVSAFLVILAALVVFIIGGREPFSVRIISDIQNLMLNNKSEFLKLNLDSLYNTAILGEKAEQITFTERIQVISGTIDYSSGIAQADKVAKLTPFIETIVNQYSIIAILFYPVFAGGITWWRANYRYYKNAEITDNVLKLKPKPFAAFTIPRRLFGLTVGLLLLSFVLQMSGSSDVMMYAAWVMQSFSYFLLGIQGIAVSEYFLKRASIFKFAFVRIIVMGIIAIVSFGIFFIFLGAIDLFMNLRMLYTKSREMKEKMKMKEAAKKEKNKIDEN